MPESFNNKNRIRKTFFSRLLLVVLPPLFLLLTGCGGLITAHPSNAIFSISPGTLTIDTNCTGCNSVNPHGKAVQQWKATLNSGGKADVSWSISGGDLVSGTGSITESGQYTPPGYLTADNAQVLVTATLNSDPSVSSTAVLTLTPGFLQPLTPENAALGAHGSISISAVLAEAGGDTSVRFALAHSATGNAEKSDNTLGSLGETSCHHEAGAYTTCSVTYTAPASVSSISSAFVIALIASGPEARIATQVLLNTAGVTSNPASHQQHFTSRVLLGSSGGNRGDYDAKAHRVQDCCGGTLGALLQDQSGHFYLLSNNHVLARSDHGSVGEAIVQPGLIDNSCSPGGSGIAPVATLSRWLPLASHSTNADAALAQVTSRAVDTSGSILELGSRQADGTLSAAPPGISSSGGKGEAPALAMRVAKSGRTTGLTCGSVTVIDLDVRVDYFEDCAESRPYLNKLFTRQIGLSGNAFSDAGDSGALIVDTANAEPIGLYFAGGLDSAGVSQAIATPASELLTELNALPGGHNYSFTGTADHAVSCLSYGDSTLASARSYTLDAAENARLKMALAVAEKMVNPAAGILGVASSKSSDRPGEAALLIYKDATINPSIPATIAGVRTIPVATSALAVAFGMTPRAPSSAQLPASALAPALAVRDEAAREWLKKNSAIFGVGVGQSLDHPAEAALVIYVDRKQIPAGLPATWRGVRTRYLFLDRLHVTRSYAQPEAPAPRCSSMEHPSSRKELP